MAYAPPSSSSYRLPSPGSKETSEHQSAIVFQQTLKNFNAMILPCVRKKLIEALHRSTLRVPAPIDESSKAGIHHCSRTHDARLLGHIKRCVTEPPAFDLPGTPSQSEYLRMGSRIKNRFLSVVRCCNYFVMDHEDGSDRDFTLPEGTLRFVERASHEVNVCTHWAHSAMPSPDLQETSKILMEGLSDNASFLIFSILTVRKGLRSTLLMTRADDS